MSNSDWEDIDGVLVHWPSRGRVIIDGEIEFDDCDPDVQKLITLASTYRAMVKYLLDNFVSKTGEEADDWLKLMDEYAFKVVKESEPKKVELKLVKE